MNDGDQDARAALGEAQILFEDNHLLALSKPAGLLTQAARAGDDNLLDRARELLRRRGDKPGKVYVGLVHRLDRNVTGVVLLARTSKAAGRLSRAFAAGGVDKRYVAVVEGRVAEGGELRHRLGPRPGERGVRVSPDGKPALLSYRVVAVEGGRSLLLVRLHTGRKHQIRAQLAVAGHPVLGDLLYGHATPHVRRPALHAMGLRLEHRVRHTELVLRAPLPADMAGLLAAWALPATPPWPIGEGQE